MISTRLTNQTGEQLWLTHSQAREFLERIEVTNSDPSPEFLASICSGIIEHIPFQNLSMLTDERIRPTKEKICQDMISGHGGLCTVRNPFLYNLLIVLGFKARYVSSTMSEPDCHISILVEISGEDWWVDVGNGFPYHHPVKLGDFSPVSHPYMDYRLIEIDNRWHIQHRRQNQEWKTNHHFSSEGVPFSAFDRMHELHYSVPGWGPFLTGLRVNRWTRQGGIILRDEIARSPSGEQHFSNPDDVVAWITKWFVKSGFIETVDVGEAWRKWKEEVE